MTRSDVPKSRRAAPSLDSTSVLAYCRPGFEGECAQELPAFATLHGAA
ncbi:MAG: hypothetical protein ACREPX_03650, partial [Rhodanobacteraceae bacterium]